MKQLLRHCCIFFIWCCSLHGYAQTTQTIVYTTKEGLPSNSVYRTLIDKKGFLWAGCETGISRYDGRTFKNYYTTQGLPDNEVTELMADSSGRVWAVAFRKKPAYYDETKDRFINSDMDPELEKINLGFSSSNSVLKFGGVAFATNEKNVYIYKEGKTTLYPSVYDIKSRSVISSVIEYRPGKYLLVCNDSLRYLDNGKIVKSVFLGFPILWSEQFSNQIFLVNGKQLQKIEYGEDGAITGKEIKEYPFELKLICHTGNDLTITSSGGSTYTLDPKTLDLKDIVFNEYIVRNVLKDNIGNFWLSTKDEGLIKIQEKRISSYTLKPEFIRNFNCILKSGNRIYAGNNKGEFFSYDGVFDIRKIILNNDANKADTWVRNIVDLGGSVYVATQTGSFIVDKNRFSVTKTFGITENKSTKAAYRFDDSTLLLGGHSQLYRYNFRSGVLTDSVVKRVTAIGVDHANRVYIGSIDGLYRWDNDSLHYFGRDYKELTYRIVSIVNSKDDLLWIGRSSDALLVLKDDKLYAAIPLGTVIPGTVCKVLSSAKPGEIWIGTDKGLNKLQYHIENGKLVYHNLHFGTEDGLIGDQVNDIFISKDTVYAATSGGISYLPSDLSLPLNDISTFITRVSINNADTSILSSYVLPFSKNNIRIEFSTVDLTGFMPFFEYSINGQDWVRAEGNHLSLQNQAPGNYSIRVRSIKRDGTPSTGIAKINFKIRKPFWRDPTFWTILVTLSFAGIIYFIQKQNRRRQREAVEKVVVEKKIAELEMQALKAQINPHFVFNCLNSIKGFIYERNYEQADKYLDKFSELLRSTMDNASAAIITLGEEIKYLDTYLQLEMLRFGGKFDYSIKKDENVDAKHCYVPAMLLQPYVENAIRHGVRFLEDRKGKINIHARLEDNRLVCEIDDNGIGREQAAAMKTKSHIEYQSRGMQLSKRRAELYNIEQHIIDKKDENGHAAGTRIVVSIPVGLKP